jgi:hypothetical protein
MENWLAVTGYEGIYEVSDHGRVRRIATWKDNWGTVRKPKGFIAPQKKGANYAGISLSRDGKKYQTYVHILVMKAFFGGIPEGLEPNHKDGNKFNNHIDNLELITHSDNCHHAHANLLSVTRNSNGTFKKFSRLPSRGEVS